MKVLITGGNSSLGVALKGWLSKTHEVYTAGRRDCDFIWNWDSEPSEWPTPEKVDVIIHTAANYGGPKYKNFMEAVKFNVIATLKVCRLSELKKVNQFIYISSIFSALKKNSPFYSSYSMSKRHAEDVILQYFSNSNFTILRPSQFYGRGNGFRKNQPFLYKIIDLCKEGKTVVFYGDYSPKRNFIYIEDFAKIVEKVIQDNIKGTYNCLFPKDISFEEIAKTAFRFFGKTENIEFDKLKPALSDNIFEYTDNLYKLIDYTPKTEIGDVLEIISFKE